MMEDFALIFDVQRERIIEISEGVLRQIKKGKNHQILSEQCCNCTRYRKRYWFFNFYTQRDKKSLSVIAVSPLGFSAPLLQLSRMRTGAG